MLLPANTEMLEINGEKSVFAVVTGRAGLAAGLAHDHLVVAADYTATLEHAPKKPENTLFEIELPTAALVVDDPDLQAALFPRLAELALIDVPFSELEEKQRSKIRRSMLHRTQLDPENHPYIRASVSSIAPRPPLAGDDSSHPGFLVELALTLKGRTVTRPVGASHDWSGGRLTVEATGTFRFTDFGIKPYSAALGAVKVRDEFAVYVVLEAEFF